VSDLQRSVRLLRISRGCFLAAAVLGVIMAVVPPAANVAAWVIAVPVAILLTFAVAQTAAIRQCKAEIAQRERELNRPRMTLDDYRRLREMEIELGWEPSELPAGAGASPESSRPACECGHCDGSHEGPGVSWFRDTRQASTALSGTGSLSAKVTWDDVAYASEASQHFAQLARVGLRHCLSCCPICADRLDALMRAAILVPGPDLGDVRGDLKRDMRDLSELDGTMPGAPMTGPGGRWRPLSELPEADAVPEGIPAAPLIEGMRQELEAQRWLDRERWEQQ